jgi:L-ascorbate metabolism protein UlaG (beta-lactamase superfamily)
MKITKYGHACLLIEEEGARLLIDPGSFSKGFEELRDLDAILITHAHADHMTVDTVKTLVKQNPQASVYADEASAEQLSKAGVNVQAMHHGDALKVGDVSVEVIGSDHAVIHADLPSAPNVGYLVAERFFYPGDALTEPGRPVEVLAAPSVAPWMSVAEAIDYVRAVRPTVAIPVHDAITTAPDLYAGLLDRLTKEHGVEVRVVPNGESTEV